MKLFFALICGAYGYAFAKSGADKRAAALIGAGFDRLAARVVEGVDTAFEGLAESKNLPDSNSVLWTKTAPYSDPVPCDCPPA